MGAAARRRLLLLLAGLAACHLMDAVVLQGFGEVEDEEEVPWMSDMGRMVDFKAFPRDWSPYTKEEISEVRRADKMYAKFRSKYHQPKLQRSDRGAVLNFEVQTGKLRITPSVLLRTKGMNLKDEWCEGGRGPLFGDVSEWFGLDADGGGCRVWNCSWSPQLEIETGMMTPDEVLGSGFLDELERFLGSMKAGQPLPGTRNHVMVEKVGKTLFQYSVGLPFRLLPVVLQQSGSVPFWRRAEQYLWGKPQEYKSLVSLVAMTLRSVGRAGSKKCRYAKWYVEPWLVRTHLGDLTRHVEKHVGKEVFSNWLRDVANVANLTILPVPFKNGVQDYKHFAEILELTGMVAGRDRTRANVNKANFSRRMPTERRDLCAAAAELLRDEKWRDRLEQVPPCVVYPSGTTRGPSARAKPATSKEWLNGLLRGKDLWSDGESKLAAVSYGHTVFKSMGAWRLQQDNFVYLEMRVRPDDSEIGRENTGLGLPVETEQGKASEAGVVDMIRKAARKVVDLVSVYDDHGSAGAQ